MKRLIKTIDLVFFQDDATGDYGLAHKNTFDDNNAFNAFWNGIGMFHDIFEHSHEKENKYFKGDYAMNVGGEMAAMGSMYYYLEAMGVRNRILNQNMYFRGTGESMKESTLSEVHEAISSGYCRYGYSLESNVPDQRPIEDGEFEYQLKDYSDKVKALPVTSTDEQEREFGKQYKQSVTFRKIANLHRYGYRMAERLVPNNWDNRAMLSTFIEFWNEFTKNNPAEEMQRNFKGLTIKLYKDENGFVSWKGVFESSSPSEIEDAVITEKTKYFSIEDHWIIPEENY